MKNESTKIHFTNSAKIAQRNSFTNLKQLQVNVK